MYCRPDGRAAIEDSTPAALHDAYDAFEIHINDTTPQHVYIEAALCTAYGQAADGQVPDDYVRSEVRRSCIWNAERLFQCCIAALVITDDDPSTPLKLRFVMIPQSSDAAATVYATALVTVN